MSCLLLLALLAQRAVADRTLVVRNSCAETIWPAVSTFMKTGSITSGKRGWQADAGSDQVTVEVSDVWNGRVWARRGCSFGDDGTGKCASGAAMADLTSTLEVPEEAIGLCNVAEINLNTNGEGQDWWDISAVPGFNIPMSVEVDGCEGVDCDIDINPECPDERMQLKADNGEIVGCLSACNAGINTQDRNNCLNCCSGTFESSEACPSSELDHYDYFKQGCEHAYAAPFDDSNGPSTVVYVCDSGSSPTYTITFCPGGMKLKTSASGSGSNNATTGGGNATTTHKKTTQEPDQTTTSSSKTTTTDHDDAGPTGNGEGRGQQEHRTTTTTTAAITATETLAADEAMPPSDDVGGSTARATSDAAATSSAAADDPTSDDEGAGEATDPLLIGLVVAGVALVLLAGGLLAWCIRRHKHNEHKYQEAQTDESDDDEHQETTSSGDDQAAQAGRSKGCTPRAQKSTAAAAASSRASAPQAKRWSSATVKPSMSRTGK